jgi:presenilin-like A22 family membrane protease
MRIVRSIMLSAVAMIVALAPLGAQRADGLRAAASLSGVAAPTPLQVSADHVERSGTVSRRTLAIGGAVGALAGGIAGGVMVNNSHLGNNEAWPLFVGGGAVIGAFIGLGIGLALTAWLAP